MANHTATKKSIRKTKTVTAKNRSRKSRIKSFIVKVESRLNSIVEERILLIVSVPCQHFNKLIHKIFGKSTIMRKVNILFIFIAQYELKFSQYATHLLYREKDALTSDPKCKLHNS